MILVTGMFGLLNIDIKIKYSNFKEVPLMGDGITAKRSVTSEG